MSLPSSGRRSSLNDYESIVSGNYNTRRRKRMAEEEEGKEKAQKGGNSASAWIWMELGDVRLEALQQVQALVAKHVRRFRDARGWESVKVRATKKWRGFGVICQTE